MCVLFAGKEVISLRACVGASSPTGGTFISQSRIQDIQIDHLLNHQTHKNASHMKVLGSTVTGLSPLSIYAVDSNVDG